LGASFTSTPPPTVAPGLFDAAVKENGCKLPAAPLQVIAELHANVAS
jgi:hypothetical protein